ncbi:MAG TPA: alpha-L-arabinofuranosidase C-terminal domain-containing protein [Actinomycetota bacterium]|nr:alpha-L-arabinofuranosidase C-terminal domain-containing protein [Actinomycetota bacterium]
MQTAEIRVGKRIAALSPYIFGGLVEHLGYAIYGGAWDQNKGGPRADVKAAVSTLSPTMLRYPGGCFSAWYHWTDGVGPKPRKHYDRTFWTDFRFGDRVGEDLSRRLGPPETNEFGTDEFLQYCLDVDAEPLLVANFGTGTPDEAAGWVRYCNTDGKSPRQVAWWAVGNETYGGWELGHCPPDQYAAGLVQFSDAMRAVDPSIKIVGVGCADSGNPEYEQSWNETVLTRARSAVDALSVHWYFPGPGFDRALCESETDYLQVATGSDDLGAMLDRVSAINDRVSPGRPVPLSLDEWNLWGIWEELLHTNARLSDALFFAGCYNRMIERADRVKLAMISQLVNCMAPIQTRGENMFVTSGYLVGLMYREASRKDAHEVDVATDSLDVKPFEDTPPYDAPLASTPLTAHRRSPAVDAACSSDGSGTTVFIANRKLDEPAKVTVIGLPPDRPGRFQYVWGPDTFSVNSAAHPETLGIREFPIDTDSSGRAIFQVPPHTCGALIVPSTVGSDPNA